jgi:hypothetical protein
MCGHKGEKLRTKLGAPEIVHECKTTKEIIQSIQRPSYCKLTMSWKKNRKKILNYHLSNLNTKYIILIFF